MYFQQNNHPRNGYRQGDDPRFVLPPVQRTAGYRPFPGNETINPSEYYMNGVGNGNAANYPIEPPFQGYFNNQSASPNIQQQNLRSPRAPLHPYDNNLPAMDYNMGGYQQPQLSKKELFRRELDEQVRLKEERKNREKAQLQLQNERETRDMASYNPFGRGGAGAPLRDASGAILADLRHMKDGPVSARPPMNSNPRYSSRVDNRGRVVYQPNEGTGAAVVPALQLTHSREVLNEAPPALESGRFSRFQFDRAPPEVQDRIQDKIRKQQEAERLLREQLEEKKRRKEEEKKRKEMEEKMEEKRLERERAELREAYEREKGRTNKKKEVTVEEQEQQAKAFQAENKSRTEKADIANQHHHQLHEKLQTPRTYQHPQRDEDSISLKQGTGISQPIIDQGGAPEQFSALMGRLGASSGMDPTRLSVLREELLGEHDSLRRQLRRQEDMLRQLRTEVTMVKRDNEKLIRKQHLRPKQFPPVHPVKPHYQSFQPQSQQPMHPETLKSKSMFVSPESTTDPVDLMLEASMIGDDTAKYPKKLGPPAKVVDYTIPTGDQTPGPISINGEDTDELDNILKNFLNE